MIGLMCLLLMVGILNNYGSGMFRFIGYASMLAVLILAQILLVYKRRYLPKKILGLLTWSVVFIILYFINLLKGIDTRSIITVTQSYLILGFLISISLVKWNDGSLRTLASIFCTINLIINIFLISYRFMYGKLPFETNPNAIGAINFYLIFTLLLGFILSKRLPVKLYFLVGILFAILNTLFIANARSILVAGFAAGVIYIIWPILTKSRLVYHFFLFIVITSIIGFTYLYTQLAIAKIGYQLGLENYRKSGMNEKIYDLTGMDLSQLDKLILERTTKSLFSGRDKIWPYLIVAIEENPILGYGPGALPDDFLPSISHYRGLSSHSFYIQIGLQAGLLGLTVLILLFFQIWKIFWDGHYDDIVRLAGAFFIAILIHQAFEVTLTQNILIIGIFQWIILAIGVSRSIYFSGTRKIAF